MASPLVCTLLFRWILPVFLLAASCVRFNGFSFIYLCCLLAIPLLPNPSRRVCAAGGRTGSFQKAVLGLSAIALFAQVVFQIVLGALPPYGHFFRNCSFYEELTREIGLNRFDHVDVLNIFRLIAPDVIIFGISLTCVLCSRELIDSSPLRVKSQQQILVSSSEFPTWSNIATYVVALMLLIAGIISPSVTCSVYFLAFLVFGTLWACHRVMRLKDRKAYAFVRVALMIYSMLHVVLLYLYQFQFFQNLVPPDTLVSRLVGLKGIIHTQCNKPSVLLVWRNLDWPEYVAPGVILLLYWLLATETRFYFTKEEREGETSKFRWWNKSSRRERRAASETQNLMEGSRTQQRTYNTLSSGDETIVHEEPIETIRQPEDYSAVQGTLGSIMMFLMRQSYIASLIIMMAWSITYHSWLTFVLLLWACLIWITPFARWFCMVSSPGLVFYAECLLIIQYIYGLQLNDTELPKYDSTLTLDFSELGLKKWKYPFFHLGAQTLFTWVFWMTLRQHIREKEMKKRERQSNRGIPLTSFAHPLVQALRKMSSMDYSRGVLAGTEMEMDMPESLVSDDAKALMMWIKAVLAKYWILLCCGAFLLVSLQNDVSVYQIGYMAIFLFILLCYQISITTWRLILRPLWWAMVIYSICILLLIYTYQFDNMPMYWHNATGLSDQWLYNFGLRQHTKASLLLELLTPTAFSIIIVIQLHFFHRPFMAMIDLRNARPDASAQERAEYGTINGICESEPAHGRTSMRPEMSTTEDGRDPENDERPSVDGETSRHTNRSLLIVILVKIAYWYNVISKLLWRIGELHTNKLINLILICVVVYQVCAINAVIIILLGISMPSRMLQRALSYCFLIWSSLVILSKMVYQLRFVQEDLFQHNCTDQTLPRSQDINHFTNNALWVGFYKTNEIAADIKGYLLIVLAIVANAVIKHHQKLYRIRKGEKDPEPGVLFSGITRTMADEDLVLCFKYLCNKLFFHYGWEVCMVMIVITMAVRCDVTSVIYALWLGVFLVLGRQNCSVVWPVYVGFLAILLPIQYLLVLGWPPGLCLPYPWKSVMDSNLVHWFYLTDVVHPQNAKLLIVDFFQLLFACCQENVFASERYKRLSNEVTSASSRSSRRSSRSRNTTPDFMWNITWLDFAKTIAFQHMYWLTLAIVYITVQSTESIFNFGFILWCFFFLWHGQALYLQPRKKLLRLWKIFIGYSYFTLLAKVCLQLVACVWVEYVKKHTGCWALQLLSMYCLREENYKRTSGNSAGGKECVAPDDSGLAMDCLCFTFLLIQLRIFSSDYFRHVVRDHREQSDMANRGAVLVNDHLRKELEQMRRDDRSKMDRIRKSVSRLKDRQSKLIGRKVEPQSHYEAIYSGDYYLFESETESENESESSSSTPRHTPEPNENMAGDEQREQHGSSNVASRQNSNSSTVDDFVSVPQETGDIVAGDQDKQSKNEGFASKIKSWCSWIYYYFAMAVDKIIEILNGISKDYREITEQLRKERKEKRKEKIRRWKLGYLGVRSSLRIADAATGSDSDMVDNGSAIFRTVEDDYDNWSVLTIVSDEADGSDWRHTQMRLARFTVALFYALLAHTDIICYMLMILNHMGYASLLSMPLPFLVFLWGMLSIPRPTKNFWITTITYVQIVIVIKYVFKFPFIKFNECNYEVLKEKQSPLCAPRLIGIERDAHTSAYDLLLLLALYFHRAFLKVHGLWRDKAYSEEGEDNDDLATAPTTPVAEEQITVASRSQEQNQSTATISPIEQDPENGMAKERVDGRRRKSESFCAPVVAFIKRMIDPEVGAGAVDVYAPMFACQFIIFLIILFSWSAFSSPEAPAEANFAQIIEENVVPKTFLYMLLTQFFLIIIDRSLYLRKFVLGKLVYLVSLVILFHIFMFIIVPYVTQKQFIQNVPAIFMYLFMCTYFGLSAYQVRCGYPTRILGNFLTKSFSLTSGVLFQGFQAIPFLLELRSVLDWVCTDTTLTLYHWLKMEDIYANIYVLKCYRDSEKTWPHNRGQKYPMLSKWGVGGLLVLLLVLVIWFPLLLMSYINSVYTSNIPTDATFSLTIGGYQPLFKVSAQEQFLKTLTDKQIDRIKDLSNRDSTGQYSKTQIEAFLQDYRGHGTVVRVKITGNSSSIWTISPPSRRFLMKELLSQDSNITMRFKYEFTREPKTALVQETISGQKVFFMEPGSDVRRNLAKMLNGTFTGNEIVLRGLFPTFVRVPASTAATPITVLFNASYVTCGLKLRVGNVPGFTGNVEWWELTQIKPPPIFDPQESVLEMITFNNLVPPLHFSFFASTGIIGLYVGFVWLIGKFVRLFFTSISYRIMFDEMPNVDKVLRLCLDIFMVRECKEFELEEDLIAKLMFLYRSPETLIKWTKYKRH